MINIESGNGVCGLEEHKSEEEYAQNLRSQQFDEREVKLEAAEEEVGKVDSLSHHQSPQSSPTRMFRPFHQTSPPPQETFLSAFSPVSRRFLSFPNPVNLFQPFLPFPSTIATATATTTRSSHIPESNNVKQVLPFSVDNILRPTFGRRARLLSSSSSSCSSSSPFLQSPPPPSSSRPTSPIQASIKTEPKGLGDEVVDLTQGPKGGSRAASKGEDDDGVPPGMVRGPNGQLWPAWVFCTRYSDRPSSGPRTRRIKKSDRSVEPDKSASSNNNDKRPRTAFSSEQLGRLKREFEDNRYLTEERRKKLALELDLNENQIKIWFQNKRAKIKKSSGQKGELAKMLMAQGLYDHSTVPIDDDDEDHY